jgi:hypothetical protein
MTYWGIGDEECMDEVLLGNPPAAALYYLAGSYVMRFQAMPGRQIPDDWFVPDFFVNCFCRGKGKQLAAYLVREGKWKRVEAGYRYVNMQKVNTTDSVRAVRERERLKKQRQRGSAK